MSNHQADADAGAVRKDGSVGMDTIVRGIRRHRFLSLLLLFATLGTGTGVWFFLPLPKMTGSAIFWISSQPQSLFTTAADDRTDFRLYCQAQSVLIKSQPVLKAALKSLGEANRKPTILEGRGDRAAWLSSNL